MTWQVISSGVLPQSSAGTSNAGNWLTNYLYNLGSQFYTAGTSSVAEAWSTPIGNGTEIQYALIDK